tara:strand:+ start:754 stop:1509 length:756 start_codon:yes stop_codon:yes gene_type:complete
MSQETTLLIDGDLFAFKTAISIEEPIQWEDNFWTLHADAKFGIKKLADEFSSLASKLKADKIIIAFSSPINFRKKVLDTYKSNRKKSRKPIIYKELLDFVNTNYLTFAMEGLEGDDVLGILATSGEIEGEVIIVSSDKDMKTIPARIYNPDKDMPEVEVITKKQADYNFMLQTLAGDSTDGYSGCPKVGMVTAQRILGEPKDVKLMWKEVVKAYEKQGLTKKDALTQSRLARILRSEDWDAKKRKPILWKP